MRVLTVAWNQLININYAFLNSAKWKILEFQGSCVGIYYVSFFLKFLQILKKQHCIFAGSAKTNHFLFEIFVRTPLEN